MLRLICATDLDLLLEGENGAERDLGEWLALARGLPRLAMIYAGFGAELAGELLGEDAIQVLREAARVGVLSRAADDEVVFCPP